MKPTFFTNAAAFRNWLQKNHDKKTALLVGFYKVGSGKPSINWSESVDQALCFGWIDGVRTSIDDTSYQIRFTPRKPGSIWSTVNINKIKELSEKGLMQATGMAAFDKRAKNKSGIYTHEKEAASFSAGFKKLFKANKKAWSYFQALAPSYQKLSINWVMSAKQEATQVRRMNMLIAESEAGTNQWKDNKYKKK
ncbi:MAG: YdeI/OmpD-associated family protein [Ferruginibacter sp.]